MNSEKPMLLSPMLYGKYCVVQMPDGKRYRRVARYNKANGLFVVIASRKYFQHELEIRYDLRDWSERFQDT